MSLTGIIQITFLRATATISLIENLYIKQNMRILNDFIHKGNKHVLVYMEVL